MTPRRKEALQFIHDRGAVEPWLFGTMGAPTMAMEDRLWRDSQIRYNPDEGWTLTDKGRRVLHEA